MPEGYASLPKHLNQLKLPYFKNVLVPLCGKSLDLLTLSEYFDHVTGAEISEKAVLEFLAEHQPEHTKSTFADFSIYRSESFTFWCGDFLKLPPRKTPPFDLIYDKAALVALPPEKRPAYAEKIHSFCSEQTAILLHHFIYNQEEMPGPPFSVSDAEINRLFGKNFQTALLERENQDIHRFKKFVKRGLKSGLLEQFLLLTP